MIRFVFWVHMTPSVFLAIFSFWFGAGLDVGKHVLSFSLAVLTVQWAAVNHPLDHADEKSHPPDISSGNLPYVKKGDGGGM